MSGIVLSVRYSEDFGGKASHFHDCNQLLFIKEGAASVTVNGRTVEAPAGSLVLTNRFERHSITPLGGGYKRYVLRVSPAAVSLKETDEMLLSVLVNRPEGFRSVIDISDIAGEYCLILEKMAEEYGSGGELCGYMLELLLYRLLALLYRKAPEIFSEHEKGLSETVRKIKTEFSENYSAEYSLGSLAAEHHISASYLAHAFKKITGTPVMNYLYLCRIAAAKKMLAGSDADIGAVVEKCGFSDHSNVCRLFKKSSGMTPTQFRNRYRHKG